MSKKDYFTINVQEILSIINQNDFLTQEQLFDILKDLKSNNLVSKNLTFNTFLLKLIDHGLKQHSIDIRGHSKIRYTMQSGFNIYTFCQTLQNNSFFPMTTSLNLQNLTAYRDKYIFVSKERAQRNKFHENKLEQKDIDNAFNKSPRRTSAYDKLGEYLIILLEANNTSSYEIIAYKGYKISSVNRAFVEIISNVHYFQSANHVIELFKEIKEQLDLAKIYNVIEKFDFVYPYYQLAGFYLESIGFKKEQLHKFYEKKSDLNFYTEKNKQNYSLDRYWNIYF
ncbi:MAG: hypothetical protein ACQESH_08960 [Campylobacterota bacterium]